MENQKIVRRVLKLMSGEILIGEVSMIETVNSQEILIKTPFEVKNGVIKPYLLETMGNAPSAIQVHPINIVWALPLDEFENANKIYIQATTGIITDTKRGIITGL
jgi:hypothetical protein